MARKVGVSSSMANNYMKSLVGQGMVAASGHTNRTMKYAVTDNRESINIVGWVDNDPAKHQLRFGEIRVCAPSLIEIFQPDAVLIASSGKAHEIRRQQGPSTQITVR